MPIHEHRKLSAARRRAWRGRCLVIIKSQKEEGDITVIASVDGIPGSEITIKSGLD